MILNISNIKTEALLLICKDIILSYKDKKDIEFNVSEEVKEYINTTINDILKQLQNVTYSNEYYLRLSNSKNKAILKFYNFINNSLSNELQNSKTFNPSMLCLSMLTMWFSELQYESKSKRFIYFSIYPYSEVYDKLLLNIEDDNFRAMNISMIEIAENIILKLHNSRV